MSEQRPDSNRHGERGAALVMALLSLGLLTALAMAMSLSTVNELGVTRAYTNQTTGFQAAEAGLMHAVSLTRNYKGANFTSLLCRRNSKLNPFEFGFGSTDFTAGSEPIPTTGKQLFDADNNPIQGATYRVRMIDDEPSGLAALSVPNFNPAADWLENLTDPGGTSTPCASPTEETKGCSIPNDPGCDRDNRVVIYSTGTYGASTVTLEAWVSYLLFPALAANDDITIGGNSEVTGRYGGVHSNKNLDFVGSSYSIAQTATASGALSGNVLDANIGGFFGGGQERLDLPEFVTSDPRPGTTNARSPHLQDYLVQKANVLLIDPSFADGAHNSDPNGSGTGVTSNASGRLKQLADSLKVSYSSLAAALDTDPGTTKVDQGSEAAIVITRASDGTGTASATTATAAGWKRSGGANGEWNLDGSAAANKTFYVVGMDNYNLPSGGTVPANWTPSGDNNGGNVHISGNPGPMNISVLATGSIVIEGSPDVASNIINLETPELPPFVKVNILFAAVEDVKVTGDVTAALPFKFAGIVYAGEQVYLSGNGSIDNGQVIALSNQHNAHTP
ncbi:MAG TPA: hypothetical protein VFV34_27370, partial [Blastocatellia bacterium]|nr:hypothetical protein [Blastocatellia bacterium]